MLEKFSQGLQFAVRASVAPLIVGARIASRWVEGHPEGLPTPRGGLAIAGKIALDEFFLATEIASAPIVWRREWRRVVDEMTEAIDLFRQRGWLDEPESYHGTPPALEEVSLRGSGLPAFPYQTLRFHSGYEPHAGEPGRERWIGYRDNQTVHAWIMRHPGPARPWIVCIPGYRMGHPIVDFTGFRARWLHRTLGLNVAIPVLPLHGPRRIGRRGGDGYFAGDFVDTVHAQAQSVWDVRRLIGWLRTHDAPAIGVHGVSLGAYTTALVAAFEPDLDCVIAGVPAADFARLLRSHVPDIALRAMDRFGFCFDRIEQLLHVVSPFAFDPGVPSNRCYLYAGLVDRLASPDHARDLWEHWGRPRVTWYHGSHVSFLWEADVKSLVLEAFEAQGLLKHARI